MKIEFQNTFEDYQDAGNIRIAKLSIGQKIMIAIGLCCSLLCAFWAIWAAFRPVQDSTTPMRTPQLYLIGLVVPYLPWFVVVLIIYIIGRASGRPSSRQFDREVKHSRWGSSLFLFLYSIVLAGTSITIINIRQAIRPISQGGGELSGPLGIGWSPWVIIFFVMLVVFFRRNITTRAKQRSESPQVRTVEYSAESVTASDDMSSNIYRWAVFNRCVETDRLFVLGGPRVGRILIPKRAFPSPDALDSFRRLIQEWADGHSTAFPVIQPLPVETIED